MATVAEGEYGAGRDAAFDVIGAGVIHTFRMGRSGRGYPHQRTRVPAAAQRPTSRVEEAPGAGHLHVGRFGMRRARAAELPAYLPNGVVTFFMSDVEGSGRHWEASTPEMGEAVRRARLRSRRCRRSARRDRPQVPRRRRQPLRGVRPALERGVGSQQHSTRSSIVRPGTAVSACMCASGCTSARPTRPPMTTTASPSIRRLACDPWRTAARPWCPRVRGHDRRAGPRRPRATEESRTPPAP